MFDHGDGVLLALPYCTRPLYQRYCTSILSMGPKCSSLVKSLHKTLFQNSTDLSTGCLAYSSSSWSRVAFNKMAQHEGHLVFFLYSALKCVFFSSFNQVTVQVFGGKLWKMFSDWTVYSLYYIVFSKLFWYTKFNLMNKAASCVSFNF